MIFLAADSGHKLAKELISKSTKLNIPIGNFIMGKKSWIDKRLDKIQNEINELKKKSKNTTRCECKMQPMIKEEIEGLKNLIKRHNKGN